MKSVFEEEMEKIHKEYYGKLENITMDQFKDAVIGAIKCGDFALHVDKNVPQPVNQEDKITIFHRQGISYIPNREKIRLESKIEELELRIKEIIDRCISHSNSTIRILEGKEP